MRAKHFISVVAMATLTVSCGTQKQVTTNQSNPFGAEITVPCTEYSYDDNENFRALGTGMAVNLQGARTAAYESAKAMLAQRFGGKMRSVSELYTRSIAVGNADEVAQILESDMQMVVDRLVVYSKKICERTTKDAAGNYNVFIAIQVSKREMKDQIIESAAKNARLGVEQHREDFRKIFEKEFENE